MLAAVVMLALGAWSASVYSSLRSGRAAPAATDSMARLAELRAAGRGGVAWALGGTIAAGALVAATLAARAVRANGGAGGALTAARAALDEGAARLPRDLTIGHWIVAFGVVFCAGVATLPWLPGPRFVPDDAGAAVEIGPFQGATLGPDGRPSTRSAPALATLRAARGAVVVAIGPDAPAGAVVADGAPVTTAAVLADGARLRVGPVEGRVALPSQEALLRHAVVASAAGLVALLATLGPLVALTRRTDAASARASLGLVSAGLGGEVRRGAVAWLATLPIYVAAVLAWQAVATLLGVPTQGHELVRLLERDPGLAGLVLLHAALLAPLSEELLHRGLLLPAAARLLSPLRAVFVTALVFGALHTGFGALLPLGLLGALFAVLRLTSPVGSLAAAVTAHALHNGATLALVIAIQRA